MGLLNWLGLGERTPVKDTAPRQEGALLSQPVLDEAATVFIDGMELQNNATNAIALESIRRGMDWEHKIVEGGDEQIGQ